MEEEPTTSPQLPLRRLLALAKPEWRRLAVATVFEDDPFVVYRLDASDPSRQPQMICAQVEPPVWQVIAVESD